ncbi:MAG: mRNA surveillance protein pelota [Candidatus Altiarchaeota archaeon]|nr:mRNA surveillance protein pelota [Candidatus Altiarchaeota archaeon]
MKISAMNPRVGVVKLRIENLDDLWYLSTVVHRGDLVKTKTERRIKAKEDIERSKKAERKTVTVALRVEKADFKSDSDTYRITGIIEEGPEDLVSIGSHHTFNVEKGSELKIIKDRWSKTELDRLREAEKAALRPKILVTVVDEGEATFGLIRESKTEYFELSKLIGGKYDTKGRAERKTEFYSDAIKFMKEILEREKIAAIVVAGAGFEKEHLYRFMSEKYPELREKTALENIGSHGRNGVQEVLKRAGVRKVLDEITSARDMQLMQELLKEIGKGTGLGAYGVKDIRNAANSGAVAKLLLCDDFFLKDRRDLEPLMETVKTLNGEVHLINHDTEAGRQLHSLGGIAALLRYPI